MLIFTLVEGDEQEDKFPALMDITFPEDMAVDSGDSTLAVETEKTKMDFT